MAFAFVFESNETFAFAFKYVDMHLLTILHRISLRKKCSNAVYFVNFHSLKIKKRWFVHTLVFSYAPLPLLATNQKSSCLWTCYCSLATVEVIIPSRPTIYIALPKLHWVLRRDISSCSGCLSPVQRRATRLVHRSNNSIFHVQLTVIFSHDLTFQSDICVNIIKVSS